MMSTQSTNPGSESADWFVFETFGADGSLAIGVARGAPDSSAAMVIEDGLTREAAIDAASRLADGHRAAGRALSSTDEREAPTDPGAE